MNTIPLTSPRSILLCYTIMGEKKEMREQLALKGTTTIGIVCKDGVILASDTRVTMAMTMSGTVADAQRTVEILKANAQLYKLEIGRLMPISAAARLIANLLFSSRLAPLVAQVLVGGVDDNGPHVFSIDPFGSLNEETCVATGSGSPIAYGVLEDKYKKDAAIQDMLPIVVRAVDSAMKRDAASGDSFNIAIIDKKGFRELTEKEKSKVLAGS